MVDHRGGFVPEKHDGLRDVGARMALSRTCGLVSGRWHELAHSREHTEILRDVPHKRLQLECIVRRDEYCRSAASASCIGDKHVARGNKVAFSKAPWRLSWKTWGIDLAQAFIVHFATCRPSVYSSLMVKLYVLISRSTRIPCPYIELPGTGISLGIVALSRVSLYLFTLSQHCSCSREVCRAYVHILVTAVLDIWVISRTPASSHCPAHGLRCLGSYQCSLSYYYEACRCLKGL